MRILVCDDEESCIQPLYLCLDQYMQERNIPCNIITVVVC